MANSSFKLLLGLYPKTENIENKRSKLIKEFEQLNLYAKSEELARFVYLDQFINSAVFLERKNYYKNLTYKNSEEKMKEDEYFRLKKSRELVFYYKFKSSDAYAKFLKMDGSSELIYFEELKSIVESPQFKKVEEYMHDKRKWEKTEEYHKINEYKELNKNQAFRNYFRFVKLKEHADFVKYVQSAEVDTYETLKKFVVSQEFLSAKTSMKRKKFKETDAWKSYLTYKQLKNNRSLQNYYKFINHTLFQNYNSLHNSNTLNNYLDLEKFVKDPRINTKEKEIKALRFNQTKEFKQLQEYNKLNSSKPIKDYYKTKASKPLADFNQLNGSKLVTDFEALEKYIQSEDFAKSKVYLLDTHKWEASDENKQYNEYQILKKSPKIIWYFKLKDNPKFNPLRTWRLVFEDDFTSAKPEKNKWIFRYFPGEVLLNDTYALPDEQHVYTTRNLEIVDSTLRIITKNEKISGKLWNPEFGFFTKEFDFSSGIISTGSSFRTKFGRIEAKVKLNSTQGILHAFWLASDAKVPQIDIFKLYDNKLMFSSFWQSSDTNTIHQDSSFINGGKVTGKYLIYTMEWAPEKIIWRINGMVMKTQTTNIPQDLMYLTLNSGVLGEKTGPLPAALEIDWVRVYQK